MKSRKGRTLEPLELKIAKRPSQKMGHSIDHLKRRNAARDVIDQLSLMRDEARFERNE